jgi:hypothetical protein
MEIDSVAGAARKTVLEVLFFIELIIMINFCRPIV